ncbi:putative peptidyl-tRNA hydrolase PTRHD1 [Lingula anatina]|uniref:peptidyl-tRNA hydrolase n=1 Tax=Lingula anatina TaxID=7574 RepID=A0A1S3JEQ0_LINAN|nr:putative peptidyl-tRNA hydrolase PTRHD1 [Lingula anatina]|eukprot:XP_013408818.1 putative peptidyl-tRNA hydrolase PTRHD1 [Lingula anatina]
MSKSAPVLVQYVLIRSDLKWPTGALIAQACHACTAVMHLFREDPNVKSYTEDYTRMHKVVLEAKDEESLTKVSESLTSDNKDFHLWIEQPENIPTCIATKPYHKEEIQTYFKKFKLFK